MTAGGNPLRHYPTQRRDPTVFLAIGAIVAVAAVGWFAALSQLRSGPASDNFLPRPGSGLTPAVAPAALGPQTSSGSVAAIPSHTPTSIVDPVLASVSPAATPEEPLSPTPGVMADPVASATTAADSTPSPTATPDGARSPTRTPALTGAPTPSLVETSATAATEPTPTSVAPTEVPPATATAVTPSPTSRPPDPTATATQRPSPEPSATIMPTRPPVVGVSHTVASGDTLTGLARAYGVAVAAIIEANNIADPSILIAGTRIVIPGATAPLPTATRAPTLAPPTATRPPAAIIGSTSTTVPDRRAAGGPGASVLFWPAVGGLSTRFGEEGHGGIDVMTDTGDPVRAAASGVVTVALQSDYGYGNRIEIDHGGGLTTLYAHLERFAVAPGTRVNAGQTIGYAGSTGYSTGPHLHFEVRVGGTPTDPLRYLP